MKYQLARGANGMKVYVHPTVCVTMIRTTAHATLVGWDMRVISLIVQETLTVMGVATAMPRLIHLAARTV